jgi:hypothetical protein
VTKLANSNGEKGDTDPTTWTATVDHRAVDNVVDGAASVTPTARAG